MKNTENTLQKGSIYLSHFPFTNLSQSKIRPIVVLSEDRTYNDVIVLAISSVVDRWDESYVVHISSKEPDFQETGLKKDSCVLLNRIATIQKDRLFKKLGQLTSDYIDCIDHHLLENFSIGKNAKSGSSVIPYGKQSINSKDVFSVVKTLRSNFLTQGPKVPEFEQAVAKKVKAEHAMAVNSATSALHLACRALDVSPGDLVWTSPITFVASANCARYCGADVDFVDIDPQCYNMSPAALEAKLAQAEQDGTLPKVVIPVHMCGQSCNMAAIHALSKKFDFSIIEDASHAIGGSYKSEPIGCCRYSDITVFSFHPVKIITTGEGGMALTNRKNLAKRMALLRSHGITRELTQSAWRRAQSIERQTPSAKRQGHSAMRSAPCALPFYYEQLDLGYNYRMTDIQAALGLSQLRRLDEFVSRRQELVKRYDRLLADLPLITPWQHPDTYSAWHLYVIRLQLVETGPTRRQVFEYLREKGIGVNVHYIPVHLQPYHMSGEHGAESQELRAENREKNAERYAPRLGIFPEAEKYYQEAITLPLFPAMTEEEQDRVCQTLRKALKNS